LQIWIDKVKAIWRGLEERVNKNVNALITLVQRQAQGFNHHSLTKRDSFSLGKGFIFGTISLAVLFGVAFAVGLPFLMAIGAGIFALGLVIDIFVALRSSNSTSASDL
jgi:hypothetical protein